MQKHKHAGQTPEQQIAILEERQLARWNPNRAVVIDKLKLQVDKQLVCLPTIAEVRCARTKFNTRVTGNRHEALFAERAAKENWTVTKRGWPDFFMYRDGQIACVEVKPDGQKLKPSQKAILSALASFGIPCFRWAPNDGFTKVEGNDVGEMIQQAT